LRGWADRVAEELSAGKPEFAYANLAIRGLLLQQILDQQIGPALALKPDLVTLSAGGNDIVFRRSDPDRLAEKIDVGVGLLAGSGATVLLFAGPDWGATPVLGQIRGKVAVFNENLHTVAARHDETGEFPFETIKKMGQLGLMGIEVPEAYGGAGLDTLGELTGPGMWDPDRLHFSPLGHHTIAAAVLNALGVAHHLRPLEPKRLPARSWKEARTEDLVWAREYLVPWVLRQVGQGPAEGVLKAKRPRPGPVFGAGRPPGPFIGDSVA